MKIHAERGFAIVAMMTLMTAMVALLGAYVVLTRIELATTRYSRSSNRGFNTAEAGLNIRAEEVRQVFVGFNVPTGTSPTSPGACSGASNLGSGDYQCKSYTLNNRTSTTYLQPDNPVMVNTTVPLGERYQTLQAQEYRYTASATSKDAAGKVESMLGLRFKSRLIPLFQFAAFYNKDLEILPGPAMTLTGPVHTNYDLYLNANTSLQITGGVTIAGNFYRGRKNDTTAMATPVRINVLGSTTSFVSLYPSITSRRLIVPNDITPYNGNVQMHIPLVTVPQPASFSSTPGASSVYWNSADLRIVLHLNSSNNPVTSAATSIGVEVRNADDTVDTNRTTKVNSAATCPGNIGGKIVGFASTFMNCRENKFIKMLEIDMAGLLACVANQSILDSGRTITDATGGGLVLYFTVDGPNKASSANQYGFRLRNGAALHRGFQADGVTHIPQGVSVVSDQAAYVVGNYNSTNKLPAAIMVDSLNVLSQGWNLTDSANTCSGSGPNATTTTMNSAFLAGTDTTGGADGIAGQNGAYNGGLENYPRFHENWSGITYTYRGSFVSLGKALHVAGGWGAQRYSPPNRDWNYDTSFNTGGNLPPMTPRFVDLRQQLFLRNYEQDN